MSKTAKEVYSFDKRQTIDRTQEPHTRGVFDIDFRVETASNPQARNWTYAGTEKTQEKAEQKITKDMKRALPFDTEYRIVNAETGEIIQEIA